MAKLTPTLKLRIGDDLDADALYNLYRIDTLGASGLFDSNGNLTLRSTTDILLRPGNGTGGRVLSNHRLVEFNLDTDTFTLNDDVTFSGSWSIPWTNISKSGASVLDFSDFDTEVSNNTDVSLSTTHRSDTGNPHNTTASQVGAYTTAQVDTLLASKASTSHTHVVADITDFSTGVSNNASVAASTAHASNTTIHFTKSSISHTEIQDIGTHTHAQIDSHINSNANPHGVTAAQVGADTSAEVTTKVSNHAALTATHGVSGDIVGTSDNQTLTNKTIDISLNTVTNISNSNVASNAAIAGSKINPNFGNQIIKTLDGIEFEEGGYKIKLQAAQSGMNADFTLSLPTAGGSSGQVLTDNGSGELFWSTIAGSTGLAEGSIRIGDATNTQSDTDTVLQGDVLADSTAGLVIKSGVIDNANINASAAIAVSKLAALTASRAVATDSSGFLAASAVTSTELGYVSGVTSSIQTQITAKEASLGNPIADNYVLTSTSGGTRSWALVADANVASGAAIAVNKLAALTASRAVATDASGFVSATSVTSTELGYLSGVTSAIQTQLGNKQSTSEKGQANGYASLDGAGKVPVSQLPNSIMEYQGTWNATTNSPSLADGAGSIGDVYRVTVAGSQDLGSGSISFSVGDYVILNSSLVWEKADTTDAVASVNGSIGIVTVNAINQLTGDVTTSAASGSESKAATIANGAVTNTKIASAAGIDLNKLAAVTASKALVSDASGFITASTVTSTEIGYLSGVTQNIQTAIDSIPLTYKTNWLVADGLTKVVTHNLGTRDVIVQLYDAVTYETLYADTVVRTDTNTVTLTIAAANDNTIRVLIMEVP